MSLIEAFSYAYWLTVEPTELLHMDRYAIEDIGYGMVYDDLPLMALAMCYTEPMWLLVDNP